MFSEDLLAIPGPDFAAARDVVLQALAFLMPASRKRSFDRPRRIVPKVVPTPGCPERCGASRKRSIVRIAGYGRSPACQWAAVRVAGSEQVGLFRRRFGVCQDQIAKPFLSRTIAMSYSRSMSVERREPQAKARCQGADVPSAQA